MVIFLRLILCSCILLFVSCSDPNNVFNINDPDEATQRLKEILRTNQPCSLEEIQHLLSHGANVNAKTKSDRTPIHFAAKYNRSKQIVKLLIEAGADVKAKSYKGYTALHFAATNNQAGETAQLLIEAGADVNAANEFNDTPIIIAARHGNVSVINLLAKAGANINHADSYGETALIGAIYQTSLPAVDLFASCSLWLPFTMTASYCPQWQ